MLSIPRWSRVTIYLLALGLLVWTWNDGRAAHEESRSLRRKLDQLERQNNALSEQVKDLGGTPVTVTVPGGPAGPQGPVGPAGPPGTAPASPESPTTTSTTSTTSTTVPPPPPTTMCQVNILGFCAL